MRQREQNSRTARPVLDPDQAPVWPAAATEPFPLPPACLPMVSASRLESHRALSTHHKGAVLGRLIAGIC